MKFERYLQCFADVYLCFLPVFIWTTIFFRANALDNSKMDPSDIDDRTVYLLPEYDDDFEGKALLAQAYDIIFRSVLENWHLIEEEDWPADRTFAKFRQWFQVEMHSMVVDLTDEPLVDDEL